MEHRSEAEELLDRLSIAMYEPPLADRLDDPSSLSTPLRNALFILAFDTEVSMGGILAFLEKLTGRFVPETISAFVAIGALKSAQALSAISSVLETHGSSTESLRRDLSTGEEFQVSSFRERHPQLSRAMLDELRRLEHTLYFHDETCGEPWQQLEEYVTKHLRDLRAELGWR